MDSQEKVYIERLDYLEKSGALDRLADLRKESRELDNLLNDAVGLFALQEIDEMFAFVTSRLNDRFIPTRLAFLIELPDGSGIDAHCYRNLKPDEDAFPPASYRSLKGFFSDLPYTISKANLEERIAPERLDEGILAYDPDWFIPMTGMGGLIGLVILGKKMVGDEYSPLERMYADRLIRFLAICIQNRLHRERSITDLKTGLYNNAFFMRRLGEELARMARGGAPSAIIMLDVDHFKHFNDTWGHLAGDEVLIGIARILKKTVRSEDIPSRFGGEEFCVLLTDCGEDLITDVAERIRLAIAGMKVSYKGEELAVTVSIGGCPLDPSWRGEASGFIERADSALYRSKALGRNRTTVYRFGLLGRASARRELSSGEDGPEGR